MKGKLYANNAALGFGYNFEKQECWLQESDKTQKRMKKLDMPVCYAAKSNNKAKTSTELGFVLRNSKAINETCITN